MKIHMESEEAQEEERTGSRAEISKEAVAESKTQLLLALGLPEGSSWQEIAEAARNAEESRDVHADLYDDRKGTQAA